MAESLSASRTINAPAEAVWALVSDLPRMGEWSEENNGGKWVGGASGPSVGAKFKGNNSNGFRRWSTIATVTACEPGQRFSFNVDGMGIPISAWSYQIEAVDDGCQVTETWTDRRPGWFKPLSGWASGVSDRAEHTRAAIAHTLDQLAATAESSG